MDVRYDIMDVHEDFRSLPEGGVGWVMEAGGITFGGRCVGCGLPEVSARGRGGGGGGRRDPGLSDGFGGPSVVGGGSGLLDLGK